MEIRNNKGEYAKKGKWGKRILGAVMMGSVCVIIGGVWAGESWVPAQIESIKAKELEAINTIVAPKAEAAVITPDRLEVKVRQLKDEVLDTLMKCESGGRKEEDGIVVLDSNDKGSYGAFQWQRTSYMHYYEKMTGNKISGRDAIIEALQTEKARKLAEWVIFETNAGSGKDWVICTRNYKLQAKVDLIKELQN
jgi:hypothetical protein